MKLSSRIAVAVGIAAALSILTLSPSHAADVGSSTSSGAQDERRFSISDSDGKTRTITSTFTDRPAPLDQLRATIELHPGETLIVASDGKTVLGIDRDRNVFLTLSAPELKSGPDTPVDAKFVVDGNSVTLAPVNPIRATRAACPQAFWGNMLFSVGATAMVCGPVTVVSGPGGLICGVGVTAASAGIDWDHACR